MKTVVHILLTEDDEDDAVLFREIISEICGDIKVTLAKDGIQLMNLLENHDLVPDLLFLDINMPRKNGFQCLTEIRSNEKLQRLPIIIISTSSLEEIIQRTFNSGANSYIIKPNDYEKWKRVIEKATKTDWKSQQPANNMETFVITDY